MESCGIAAVFTGIRNCPFSEREESGPHICIVAQRWSLVLFSYLHQYPPNSLLIMQDVRVSAGGC
jgi:hypothetical protein